MGPSPSPGSLGHGGAPAVDCLRVRTVHTLHPAAAAPAAQAPSRVALSRPCALPLTPPS